MRRDGIDLSKSGGRTKARDRRNLAKNRLVQGRDLSAKSVHGLDMEVAEVCKFLSVRC